KTDALLIKLDSKGKIQWSKVYGGSQNDFVNEVIQTLDKGFIIVGHSQSNDKDLEKASNKGNQDYWILKLTSNGDIEWSKTYGGTKEDMAESVIQTSDAGYIVAGSTTSLNGDLGNIKRGEKDYWIIKLDSKGALTWSKTYGGTLKEEVASIILTSDAGYIVAGNSTSTDWDLEKASSKGNGDAWLVKFAPPVALQSDTSDAVFSIIMPQPVIQYIDIDMGQMIVGNTKDTIVSSVICNGGDAPFHVLGVDIRDAFDSEDFLIPRGAGDFYLEKDSCQDMMFEFTPSALGNRTAVATIRTTIGDFKDTIHIRGVGINPFIEATAEVVDFGVFELGEGKDTTVILVKNVGSTDINITDTRISGPDMEQFTISTTPLSYTISAGQEKEFKLNYTAKLGGKSNSHLDFHFDGISSPIRSLLFAEGIGGEVYPEVADAYAGETVNLNLFLGKIKPEGLSEIATNFSATVSYNSTLLAPIDKSIQVTNEDNKSYIKINGELRGTNQIAGIPMKVGLGTADRSGLVITEFQLYNANGDSVDYDIEPGVGEFNVLGICEEGGKRLINPNGEAVDMVVTTDGFNSNARINLTLIETGQTELILFDQIGNKVETVYSGTPSAGQQELNLDLSKYSNGRYYIKLTTPTITKTEIIEVVR
ncbi:MAG: choice-of-anchor D domain-containing protein, partial [Candidatus Kapaibacterium sp.]